MKKVKVLHIIEKLENRGAEKQLVLLANGLHQNGFDVSVCCFRSGGELGKELIKNKIHLIEFEKNHRIDLGFLFKLIRFIQKNKFQIIHTHVFTANLWGRLAASVASVPIIVSHEHGSFTLSSKFRKFSNRFLAKKTNIIFVVNEDLKIQFVVKNKIPSAKIQILSNGLDFNQLNGKKSNLQKKFSTISPLIGTVGALEPRKNHISLLAAAQRFLQKYPSAEFLFIGDGEEKSILEKTTSQLKLNNKVHFLGNRNDVFPLLKMMDVFVLPSFTEGTSLALLESLAVGTPVVATSVGGTPEVLHFGKYGYLLENSSPESIAKGLETILTDSTYDKNFKEKTKRYVKKHFDIRNSVSELSRTYNLLINRQNNAK